MAKLRCPHCGSKQLILNPANMKEALCQNCGQTFGPKALNEG